MDNGTLALMIPILGISCGLIAIIGGVVIRPMLKLRERRMEIEAQMVAERAAQYASNTGRIEERLRVLERIVTDRGIDVADEIEKLRDAPLN
ncbi:MAG: hypothetical protein ACKVOB_12660 [Sphingomonas sp.]